MTEPPVPKLGIGDCVHCQLRCSIVIHAQVKHKLVNAIVFFSKWQFDTKCFQSGVPAVENGNDALPCRCLHRNLGVPNRLYNRDLDPNEVTIAVVVGGDDLENPFANIV